MSGFSFFELMKKQSSGAALSKEEVEFMAKESERERLVDAENEKLIAAEKKSALTARINKRVVESLGSIYTGKNFENYRDEHGIVDKIKPHIMGDEWMYIYGESRCGKTHLLAGIYFWLCEKGIENIVMKKSIELDLLFSDYRDELRADKIEAIKSCEILLIDDLGIGKLTQERHSMYYYIIDYRISNNKKTVITSNYKTNDLWAGSIDASPTRIITRIQEISKGFEVKPCKK